MPEMRHAYDFENIASSPDDARRIVFLTLQKLIGVCEQFNLQEEMGAVEQAFIRVHKCVMEVILEKTLKDLSEENSLDEFDKEFLQIFLLSTEDDQHAMIDLVKEAAAKAGVH